MLQWESKIYRPTHEINIHIGLILQEVYHPKQVRDEHMAGCRLSKEIVWLVYRVILHLIGIYWGTFYIHNMIL